MESIQTKWKINKVLRLLVSGEETQILPDLHTGRTEFKLLHSGRAAIFMYFVFHWCVAFVKHKLVVNKD